MCGIAGFVNFKNNLDLAHMANEIQIHRGPDAQDVWADDFIALAHQRLSIIDLDVRSNQPFVKSDYVIIYNGELYNYKELKEKHLKGIDFITNSDTEVVLEMYIQLKEESLEHFIGMFSFCIYNTKNNEVFCARDHFGIKPFYFYHDDTKFAFASELKTMVQLPGFDKSINHKSLISSLNYLWIPGNDTIFSNISKLPPAHYLKFNNGGIIEIKRYWQLDTSIDKKTEDSIIGELDLEFENTMKRHMVADVPVSSFLSGGLDSSMISVAAKRINTNISTYTIGTEAKDKKIERMPDDQKYAKILADINNFDHHEIVISSNITKELPAIVRALDEPIGDPAAINTYLICRAARENGVKVLLSGMGADEILCGYRRQKAILMAEKYKSLPSFLRGSIRFVTNLLPVKIGNRGFRLARWSKKFITFAEKPTEEAYRSSYSYYNKIELSSLLKDNNDSIIDEIYKDHQIIFDSHYKGDIVNKMCYTDINMFMVGLNLTYTDRASMAASVEVRVPFIDKEFIAHTMKIDGKYKYKNSQSKYVLKRIAEKYLPKKIIYRPKAAFGAPIRSWISGDLKNMVDEHLSRSVIEKRGLFNYDYINKLITNDRLGIEDNAYRLYQLLTIELWFKEFID